MPKSYLFTKVGDGTTSVVIIAAELLKRANELVKSNIHPTVVMSGYRLAMREAVKYGLILYNRISFTNAVILFTLKIHQVEFGRQHRRSWKK
jgi:chaperonin GroEL (HSP60 family)